MTCKRPSPTSESLRLDTGHAAAVENVTGSARRRLRMIVAGCYECGTWRARGGRRRQVVAWEGHPRPCRRSPNNCGAHQLDKRRSSPRRDAHNGALSASRGSDGNRTPDLFHAKEATAGRGFSAVSAAFVRDPLPWKPRRDSRLQKQFRPLFACQAIPRLPRSVRR